MLSKAHTAEEQARVLSLLELRFRLQVMRHADDEVYNRKSHEHDFEVLITQKGDKKLEETLSFLKHPIRLGFYAVLNRDVDLVNCRCANFPMVHSICHSQALLL